MDDNATLLHVLLNTCFQFFASGEAQQYDTYFISDNGRDKSLCGKTADSACKSLKYVLSIYYNKNQSPQPELLIIISKSLTINKLLVVS